MDIEEQNPWWVGAVDEQYETWNSMSVKWVPRIVEHLVTDEPGLSFLTGPRQVGKTTALKLLINRQLRDGKNPWSIFYCACDEILNFKELGEIIDAYLAARDARGITRSLIVIDEITFVEEWWRAIKSRLDGGYLSSDSLIISGSASIELLKEKERFPGRRGSGQDYVLYPLSFQSFATLTLANLASCIIDDRPPLDEIITPNKVLAHSLTALFLSYLNAGGFPSAVRDYLTFGSIRQETKRSLLDWVRGDVSKAEKGDAYMKEILATLLRARNSPISWLSITKETGVKSPHTVQSYVEILEQLYIVKVLHLISPEGRIIYRKNKKVHFIDPFLARVLAHYTGVQVPDEMLVESTIATHIARKYPVFYWKNSSEVDVIGVLGGTQVGFEVKWGFTQYRKPAHLKEFYYLTKDAIPLFLASIDWDF